MPPPNVPAHFGSKFTKTVHTEPSAAIDPSEVTLPEGYTVLITGAGKGIGEHIARSYAQAKATNIIITSRTASDLDQLKCNLEDIANSQNHKTTVRTLPSDASKLETYKTLRCIIETEFSNRLDCLIANAGTIGSSHMFNAKLHETDPEEHARLVELDYLGPMYAMNQLIPVMLNPQSTGKLIVNVSSAASHMTSIVPIAYSVSKHAQNRLAQHVGETYKEEGLVCVALHPGGVKSHGAQFAPSFMQASECGISSSR